MAKRENFLLKFDSDQDDIVDFCERLDKLLGYCARTQIEFEPDDLDLEDFEDLDLDDLEELEESAPEAPRIRIVTKMVIDYDHEKIGKGAE